MWCTSKARSASARNVGLLPNATYEDWILRARTEKFRGMIEMNHISTSDAVAGPLLHYPNIEWMFVAC